MSKVWVCWVTVLCVSTACGNGDDDTSNVAGAGPTGGTGGASAGTGGSSAASGGTGAGVGGSGAQSGTGGSGLTGGGAGTGGTAGRGGSGAAGSSGGQAARGGSAGQMMIPPPTGTIGSGVTCSVGDATECPDDNACCHASSGATCVSAFSDCACSVQGTCLVVGCDSPADCGSGNRCCALLNPRMSPVYHATSCKSECGSGEREVCVTDDDCNSGDQCMHGSQGFDWCF